MTSGLWKRVFTCILRSGKSGIPALVKFAELKEKRIDGLIAHAIYPISTGKLEGLTTKSRSRNESLTATGIKKAQMLRYTVDSTSLFLRGAAHVFPVL